jgi:hypothetical protein
MGVIYETSLGVFLLVTVFLGGGAAYASGRAVALTWKPLGQIITYSVLLAAAARFLHFSLFGGTLLTVHYFIADLIVLLIFAGLGFRLTRARQMAGQYGWLYERTGPLTWRERPSSLPARGK